MKVKRKYDTISNISTVGIVTLVIPSEENGASHLLFRLSAVARYYKNGWAKVEGGRRERSR
ncbi:MAG: hypothetical protein P9L88_06890 [Candidatus Tantalella remota]|nr:hypothetical protein [Candidatus Tantalella remota]